MSWVTTHSAFERVALPQVELQTWTQETRLGQLVIATSPRGVALMSWSAHEAGGLVARLKAGYEAAFFDAQVIERRDAQVAEEIEAFLSGSLRRFSMGVDLTAVRAPFHRQVLETLCTVDYGQTTTYGRLARTVGRPGGARAVGQAVGMNPIAILVPCHRVLASDGSLGGYSAGLERKRALLELEGHGASVGTWPAFRR